MPSLPGREAAIANPRLADWAAFIGEWETTGSHPYLPGRTLKGRASFAWLEGGAFVIMRTGMDAPEIPSGIAIIGSDDATLQFMLYFDERGVSRRYDVTTQPTAVAWSRDAADLSQRFVATLAPDGDSIEGKGEMSKDGGAWEADLSLTYRRVRRP